MKKHILPYISLILLIASNHIVAMSDSKATFIKKWMPTIYTATWAGTIAAEALSLAFIPINHALYGNNTISKSSIKIIRNLIDSVQLQGPLNIKAARSLWTSLGENVFSHQKTLFVNPNVFNQPNFTMTDNLKKEIISAAVAINNNYDTKILTATIAIPLAVWTAALFAHKMMQKLNTSEYQSSWIKKIAKLTKKCKKSFYIKAGVSLGVLVGYILYQRHLIAGITKTLLAGQ
jgi:hypothetical protein